MGRTNLAGQTTVAGPSNPMSSAPTPVSIGINGRLMTALETLTYAGNNLNSIESQLGIGSALSGNSGDKDKFITTNQLAQELEGAAEAILGRLQVITQSL